jgi:cyclic pyranopterin phosphate synthase
MPSEGIELSPQSNILTDGEILRLAALFVKNGVTKIRLTGGEPTVRKGIAEIICKPIYGIDGIDWMRN